MDTQSCGTSPPKREFHNSLNINTQFLSSITPSLTLSSLVLKTRHLTSGHGRTERKSSEFKMPIPISLDKFLLLIKLDSSLVQMTKHSSYGPQILKKFKPSLAIQHSSSLSNRSDSVTTFQEDKTEPSRFGKTKAVNKQSNSQPLYGL